MQKQTSNDAAQKRQPKGRPQTAYQKNALNAINGIPAGNISEKGLTAIKELMAVIQADKLIPDETYRALSAATKRIATKYVSARRDYKTEKRKSTNAPNSAMRDALVASGANKVKFPPKKKQARKPQKKKKAPAKVTT